MALTIEEKLHNLEEENVQLKRNIMRLADHYEGLSKTSNHELVYAISVAAELRAAIYTDHEKLKADMSASSISQILAADGEQIKIGQSLWGVESGHEYVVDTFVVDGSHGPYVVEGHYAGYNDVLYLDPNRLTHQRPVLDADDMQIKEGDTVWGINSGYEYDVIYIDRNSQPKPYAICVYKDAMILTKVYLDRLTHTKPEHMQTKDNE